MRRAAGIATAALLSACVVHEPAPAVPQQIVPRPNVVLGEAAPGDGDVLIDTVGGAADVYDETKAICTTPCEVHLSQGLHDLRFVDPVSHDARGDGRITVGKYPSAYRYALGRQDFPVAELSIAYLLAITGGSVGFAGLVAGSSGLDIAGGALLLLGIVGGYVFRPHLRDGTGVQWTPRPGLPSDAGAPGADLR